MFGLRPRHPQAAEGYPNGFVTDEPWGEPLGETDLGSQRERPPARRLALSTGKENLAAADGKGGRRPETGLQCCPLVRREQAYK